MLPLKIGAALKTMMNTAGWSAAFPWQDNYREITLSPEKYIDEQEDAQHNVCAVVAFPSTDCMHDYYDPGLFREKEQLRNFFITIICPQVEGSICEWKSKVKYFDDFIRKCHFVACSAFCLISVRSHWFTLQRKILYVLCGIFCFFTSPSLFAVPLKAWLFMPESHPMAE